VRVPSGRDVSRLGIELAKLNCGLSLSDLEDTIALLHNAIAYSKACLIEAPTWFTNTPENEKEPGINYGLDSPDLNVVIEVFQTASAKVNEWHTTIYGAK
jgi:hypothetical protein